MPTKRPHTKQSRSKGSPPVGVRRTVIWNQRLWWCILPALIALAVWWKALSNGFVWDDRTLIAENRALAAPGAVWRALTSDFWTVSESDGRTNYYRPIVTISYIVDRALYGVAPWGYHLTNIIIHALNCALLAIVLVQLRVSLIASLVCASLVAIHPACGEAAAWISGRTDSLAMLWVLVALIAGRREHDDPEHGRAWRRVWTIGFVFALGSKEIAIITPILTYLVARSQGDSRPTRLAFSARACMVVVGWLLVRTVVLQGSLRLSGVSSLGLGDGAVFFLHVLGNIVWPPIFRIEYGSDLSAQSVMLGAVCGGAVMVLALLLFLERSTARDRTSPSLAGWLCGAGLVACIPAILAIYVKAAIGSRLLYGPALFLLPGFALAVRARWSERIMVWSCVCVGLLAVPCAMARARLWRSDIILFEEALKAPQYSTRVHLNLGIALYDAGRLLEAKAHLEHVMERPAQDQQEYMLGLLYTVLGCETKAEQHYTNALLRNPANIAAATNVSGLYASQGRKADVTQMLSLLSRQRDVRPRVVAMIEKNVDRVMAPVPRPAEDGAWCGDDGAVNDFLRSAPRLDERGVALLKMGQIEMAGIVLSAAYRLEPTSRPVRLHYAECLLKRGEARAARAIAAALVQEDPNDVEAKSLLSGV